VADEKIMIIVGEGGERRVPAVFSSVGLGSCVAVTFMIPKGALEDSLISCCPVTAKGRQSRLVRKTDKR